jgi:hypothetical protein
MFLHKLHPPATGNQHPATVNLLPFPPVNQSTNQPINQSTNQPINLLTDQPIN